MPKVSAPWKVLGAAVVLIPLGQSVGGGADQELPARYARSKADAESLYEEGSYARAAAIYRQLAGLELPAAEKRWVAFRIADAGWRSQAASNTHDHTRYEDARSELEAIASAIQRPEDRDAVWAEAHESLGDFWWARRDSQNWYQGWTHYQQALDWWAGHDDLEAARRRYLEMVWRMAAPAWQREQGWYGYHNVPLDVLENACKIARAADDRARAHYLLAVGLRSAGGSWPERRRVEEQFEAAHKNAHRNPWYDDALFHYAQWLANTGRVILTTEGSWRHEPDFVKAVELYRRLVNEYGKGETRYYDEALGQIQQITGPELTAVVANVFLPGSEVRFDLRWRNLPRIDLSLHRVELTRDVGPGKGARHPNEWVWHLDPSAGQRVKAWSFETRDTGAHNWGQESVRLDEDLPVGAYLLVATGGGRTARDLVLVSDLSVVLKAWRGKVIAYACDALDGSPVKGARVRLWSYRYRDDVWSGRDATGETDADGLCTFDVDTAAGSRESWYGYLVTVSADGRQAFVVGGGFATPAPAEAWKVYATADRPAYRPGETVEWKIIARTNNGQGYATPQSRVLRYEITGPRGKVDEGKLTLNTFGSAWSRLTLSESMALGEYQVGFRADDAWIGSATLFRLEEYKLPEFEVSVTTPQEDGRQKAFRLGETVEVAIEAGYYFGGPVANADVRLTVYQKPFHHWWVEPRDYPWCYEGRTPYYYDWGGYGQIVRQEALRTDETGRAAIFLETPAGGAQDFEYRIEAAVTDASRREIIGSSTVRVTSQRYYVYPRARQNVYHPGDRVEVDFRTIDANQNAVTVEGEVKVTRDRWVEVWLDPSGREVSGRALQQAKGRFRTFPPKGGAPWELKFRGYSSKEVVTRTVKTGDQGEATFVFAAGEEGYYRVAWRSQDAGAAPITAETAVWVADGSTIDVGYRSGGVEIIVDRDTFRAGQTASVMLTVPTNDRWILFSVEGDDLHRCEVIHVPGTARLIQIPIEPRHVPNVYLSALMVSDGQLLADREEVVVPPVEHFLDVEVAADREAYEPQEEGWLTVTTRDVDGKPVAAEIALSVVDESVYYIQQAYGGDPRRFFFDRRQAPHLVWTGSTFAIKPYVKLVEADNELLIDARELSNLGREEGQRGDNIYHAKSRQAAGRGGGYDGDDAMSVADAAAPMESLEMKGGLALSSPPMGQQAAPGQEPAVVVRTDFRSTILWQPDVVTADDGKAVVKVKYADNLTRWKATACAATAGSRFGIGEASTRTRQPLIARLQAPRFFVAGDTVILSGVFNNNTEKPMTVRPALEVEGLTVTGVVRDGRAVSTGADNVRVPAGAEARVDWLVAVEQAGPAKVRLTARSDEHADAMEKAYRVHEHGIEKLVARSGKVRGDAVTVRLDLPAARRADTTVLTVGVSSSLGVTMLDALPYLIDYPYGCTEQTMSRFLPAVVTARTMQDLGLSADDALGKVFGGIEREFVDKTHPDRRDKRENIRKLDSIVREGLERLYDFQHGDGGWGWWKPGESDHFMTAYVLWGLCLARGAGVEVRPDVCERAAHYLRLEIVEAETSYDLQAWMLHALAAWHAATEARAVGPHEAAALNNLWASRDHLNAYTRSLLALAAHDVGDEHKAKVLVRNLENGVKRDDAPDESVLVGTGRRAHAAVIGTAHWGDDGISWRWSSGPVEATAFALRALLRIEPEHELIEPVMNWLVKNRRGSQWSNTRDTAIAVLALNDYLKAGGELEPAFEYELLVNGRSVARRKVTAADALGAPSRFEIEAGLIVDGLNEIRIERRNGQGAIYFSAEATYFSEEEPVTAAGNEIFVRRDYYKLVPRETLLKGYVYDRVPMADGDYVTSGERVEVVVTVEAKNDYEYLVFEDLKPAGLEAVQIRSGEAMQVRELASRAVAGRFDRPEAGAMAPPRSTRLGEEQSDGDYTGRTRQVHQELRDRKVALFVDKLPEGVWEITYDLRAEVPGRFHALPVLGHAMYVPEIRCNSDEVRITVNDRPAEDDIIAVGD